MVFSLIQSSPRLPIGFHLFDFQLKNPHNINLNFESTIYLFWFLSFPLNPFMYNSACPFNSFMHFFHIQLPSQKFVRADISASRYTRKQQIQWTMWKLHTARRIIIMIIYFCFVLCLNFCGFNDHTVPVHSCKMILCRRWREMHKAAEGAAVAAVAAS